MKPPPFSYHAPSSVSEAVSLLASLENARVLAGGQSLLPMLNMRFATPDHVIDINPIPELSGISVRDSDIVIGAMTRQREIEFSNEIKEHLPLMHEALQFVGHRQTRNRGTIGGSLCHLDPAAELPCVCAAYDATVEVVSDAGVREIPFAEFPLGYLTPSIEPAEMVRAISNSTLANSDGLRICRVRAQARRLRHRVSSRADVVRSERARGAGKPCAWRCRVRPHANA